jgi:hypothetical protein
MEEITEECLLEETKRKLQRLSNPKSISKITALPNFAINSLTSSSKSQNIIDHVFNEDKNSNYSKVTKNRPKNLTTNSFKSKGMPKAPGILKSRESDNNLNFKNLLRNNFIKDNSFETKQTKDKSKIRFRISERTISRNNTSFSRSGNEPLNETTKFLEKSKLKVDNTLLSKENKNIKNLLSNFIIENNKKLITKNNFNKRLLFPVATGKSGGFAPSHDGPIEGQRLSSNITQANGLKINPHPSPRHSQHNGFNTFRSEADEKVENSLTPDNKSHKSNYFRALSDKLEMPRNSSGFDNSLDTDIDDIDFPLNHEHLEHKKHYYEKFCYKLYIPNRELVTMKNVYDSMSDEETLQDKTWYLINPISLFKMIWDVFAILCAIYNIVAIPYELAFDLMDGTKFYTHMFIDLFFTFDAILSFFTGYYQDDKIIYNFKMIVQYNYTSLNWYLSFISSFPFESLVFVFEPRYLAYETFLYKDRRTFAFLLQIYKFVRYIKWIQLYRIFNIRHKIETLQIGMKKVIDSNLYLKAIISYLSAFLLLIYLATCFWCYLGYRDVDDIHGTWITFYNLTDADETDIFVSALYYVLATMFTIGYGDISPQTTAEHLYVSLLMTIGSVIWSFLLTAFSQFFIDKDEKTQVLKERLNILDILKKEHNLTEGFIERIKKSLFFDYKSYKKDRIGLINYLPTYLRNELYLAMYKTQVTHLKFFKNQSYEFIITVLPLLKNVQMLQEESVVTKGDIVKHLYMVVKGVLSVVLSIERSKIEISQIKSSFHIGDILMYMEDQSPYDIVVKTKVCNLFVMARQDFAELKLSFKDAVSNILVQSHKDFCEIEKRRSLAIDYHSEHKTFFGFRINLKEPMFSTSSFGQKTMFKMSQVSSQISKEIRLDSLLSKSRVSQTTHPDKDIRTPQDLGTIIEKGDEENEKANQTKKYISSSCDSSNLDECEDDIHPLNSGNKLKKTIRKPATNLLEIIEEVKEAKETWTPATIKLSTPQELSLISDQPKKHFALSPANKVSDPQKFFPQDMNLRKGSLFVNPVPRNKLGINLSPDRRLSIDRTNTPGFMLALNQKIFQDIAIQRNPEIVQDQIIDLIALKNITKLEKLLRKVDKILLKLNDILIMNLKRKGK